MENNIRRLRKDKGYTQKDLSKLTGVSIRQIQALEAGKHMPGYMTSIALANE